MLIQNVLKCLIQKTEVVENNGYNKGSFFNRNMFAVCLHTVVYEHINTDVTINLNVELVTKQICLFEQLKQNKFPAISHS